MQSISFNKNIKINPNLDYLFSTNWINLALYFGIKNKNDYLLVNRTEFIQKIIQYIPQADLYLIPESSNIFLEELVKDFKYIILKKNNKDFIFQSILNSNKFNKEEKISLKNQFEKMETFSIHKLKLNKRKYSIPFLFKNVEEDLSIYKKIIILDDIAVSNSTMNALEYQLKKICLNYQTFVIFKEIK